MACNCFRSLIFFASMIKFSWSQQLFPNFLEITFHSFDVPQDYSIGDSGPRIEIAWSDDRGVTEHQYISVDSGIDGLLARDVGKFIASQLSCKNLYVKNLSDDLELCENFFKGIERSFELIDLNELFRDKPSTLYQSLNVVDAPGIAKRTVENYIAIYLKLRATLIFVDFEASSLNPDSYPIEVAWSIPDDSIESHLISPFTS